MAKNSSEMLLDTHILLWFLRGDKRLSKVAIEAIERSSRRHELLLSAITLWEVGYLLSKGKLQLKMDIKQFWEEALNYLNATEIAIASADVLHYHNLPDEFHGDPGDRFLVAQAMSREIALLTADEKILAIRDKLQPCRVVSPNFDELQIASAIDGYKGENAILLPQDAAKRTIELEGNDKV